MSSSMSSGATLVAAVSLALVWSGVSAAAVLDVQGGTLVGATGVIVGGQSYDVVFFDGTCAQVFDPCDAPSFAFSTQPKAVDAAQALMDQVFINLINVGDFDTEPDDISGCDSMARCRALVPYDRTMVGEPGHPGTNSSGANNFDAEPFDDVLAQVVVPDADDLSALPGSDTNVWAVFTPSAPPVPLAGWMPWGLLLALGGVAVFQLRS